MISQSILIQDNFGFWIHPIWTLDSWDWIRDSGFWRPCQWNLDSGFQSSGVFRIPWAQFNKQDSTIWIFLHGATHFMLFKILLVALNTVFDVEFWLLRFFQCKATIMNWSTHYQLRVMASWACVRYWSYRGVGSVCLSWYRGLVFQYSLRQT